MLNKLKFNNMVISNKKKIRQGRIQTINKLVQKLRKLKALSEKHPDNTKNKERLRKATENIEHLKKYKCVDIIKSILLLEKNPSTVITNGRSSPEEIAVALLANNKIIQGLITVFRQQLSLTDENRKWREELLETSKRRAKIHRTEEKKKKRKDIKDQKANERKRLDWIKENNPYADGKMPEENEGLIIDGWKVEPIDVKSRSPQKEKPLRKRKANYESEINDIGIKIATEKKENKTKPKKQPKLKQTSTIVEDIVKIEDESKLAAFNQRDRKLLMITAEKKAEKVKSEPVAQVITHVVDPFFITESGENYLSTAVIIRDKFSNVINPEVKEFVSKPVETNGRENRTTRRLEKNKRDVPNYYDRDNKFFKRDTRSNQNNHELEKNQQNVPNFKNDYDKLHPSWAAKQKCKPIIVGFQGKKITFDDNNEDGCTQNMSNSSRGEKLKDGKTFSKEKNRGDLNLHPSWLAKQKLKPVISAFQGKKIVFEN